MKEQTDKNKTYCTKTILDGATCLMSGPIFSPISQGAEGIWVLEEKSELSDNLVMPKTLVQG